MPKKLSLSILIIFVLTAFVLISAYLIRRSELRRSGAAATAQVLLDPATAILPPNQNFRVLVGSGDRKVGFAHVVLTFDNNLINLAEEVTSTGVLVIPERADGTKLVTSMAEANSTGRLEITFILPVEQTSQAPSGTFELTTLSFTSIFNQQVNTTLSFDSSAMEVVDLLNAEDMVLNVTGSSLALNPTVEEITPTPTATASPTTAPTEAPTAAPTASPTTAPTSPPSGSADERADINGDGRINLLDYIILLENFGKTL